MLLDAHGRSQQTKDAQKLAIMAFDHARRYGACQYYRITVPMRALDQMGKAFTFVDEGTADPQVAAQAQLQCDVLHMYGMSAENTESVVNAIKLMKPQKDANGILRTPPITIYDIDDNNDYVNPFNPAFETLGYRDVAGTLMEPGDGITVVKPDGTEMVMWQDGRTLGAKGQVFSVARNRALVADGMKLARMVHGVTVPSVSLANYFKQVQKCENVHVFPNTIVPSDWRWPNLAPRTDGKIRVLWQGGDSHFPDWYPIRHAVTEVCRKYPHVTFVLWGSVSSMITDAIPADQLEVLPWVGFDGYKLQRAMLDCDINLAPLVNNVFNRGKSAIKWYEASVGPRPEATLASNVAPYNLEMVDGVSGLLYSTPDEFVQKLSLLIENADLRQRLAEGARTWVLDNRTPEHTIPPLYEFYQELRARRRQEFFTL